MHNIEEGNENGAVYVDEAFYMFIKLKIKPYYRTNKLGQRAFRDNALKSADIEVVYTMNGEALKSIYKKYSLENRGTKNKPHNGDWMILDDCNTLLTKECKLPMTLKVIKKAFSMSKVEIEDEFAGDVT